MNEIRESMKLNEPHQKKTYDYFKQVYLKN